MAYLLKIPSSLSPLSISSSFNPKPNNKPSQIPARDLVIDFGKHKGRMLGSLPSKYLTWVSKTLRARDSLRWAELADQVLADPIYRDRIEWESAEKVLSGNNANALSSSSPVSDLLEISERFGWDNEDKEGWARVDFGLLGTSKGGRIPRVRVSSERRRAEEGEGLVKGVSAKREERRERRREKMETLRREIEDGDDGGFGMKMTRKEEESLDIGNGNRNPFPGRGALLDKIDRWMNEI